jgi:hypothetical protein
MGAATAKQFEEFEQALQAYKGREAKRTLVAVEEIEVDPPRFSAPAFSYNARPVATNSNDGDASAIEERAKD